MSSKDEIKQALKAKRPALSDSSLSTYVSVLNTALKALDMKLADISKDGARLVARAMSMSIQSGKTLLSTLVVLTDSETFRVPMKELMEKQKEFYAQQKKSEHRSDIELTFENIKQRASVSDELIKSNPSQRNLVDNLILNLMTGVRAAPRRLEWAMVKVKNYDPETDNYLKGNTVVFNKYKTSKKYGQQEVKLDPETMKTVKKLMKLQPKSDHLLTTVTGKAMSGSVLSKRIGQVMGNQKVGVDVLRSLYVSHVHKGPPQKEIDALAEKMGHSAAAATTFYRKVD